MVMEKENMIMQNKNRVRMKGDRAGIPSSTIFVVVVGVILIAVIWFMWAPCADCSDVEKIGFPSGPGFCYDGELMSICSEPSPQGNWYVGYHPQQGPLYYNTFQELADDIDNMDLSEDKKNNLHHIADCVERGCT